MTVVDAERLAEVKASDVPRASLALMGDHVDGLDAFDEQQRAAIDEHLSHFAWLVRGENDEDGRVSRICPGCNTTGFFGWGLVHGSGSCGCGWPGTLWHRISDDVLLDMLLWAHPDEVELRGRS